MKNFVAFALCVISTVGSAATLAVEEAPGLQNGSYSVDCVYQSTNAPGYNNHFDAEGLNNPPGAPSYGLAAALNAVNVDVISDKSVDYIRLDVVLTCGNGAKVKHHFETEQLKASGPLILKAPQGCAQ